MIRAEVGPCPCECNRGGFCGGCGHAGCGGRRAPRSGPVDRLTRRELEVWARLAAGESNREIARALYLSDKTVKAHVSSILRRLEVDNRTRAAAVWWQTHGTFQPALPMEESGSTARRRFGW